MFTGLRTYRFFHDALSPLLRVALACAVIAHAILLALFQPVITVQTKSTPDGVVFTRAGWSAELQREWSLLDTEPLYMPTSLNYGYSVWDTSEDAQASELIGMPPREFTPQMGARPGTALALPTNAPEPSPPLESLLSLSHWGVAATLGLQAQPGLAAPPPRQAFMRIERLEDSELVLEEPIRLGLTVDTAGEKWRPAAFSYWVDRQGAVSAPVPLPWTEDKFGSGNAAVDAAMRKYITASGLAARLRPGYYRVIIGP
ncbi:MAG: hypothetical protein LBV54_03975 [Puniceicoccales bacterium]|jgi:hypothetical protein|nr:hypothetical protein [Puniceicoccales bacterium]